MWELYHVAEDFSETVDLAAAEPERLRQLIELWWSEAERNQVLPLNNQPGRHADRRHRRERYEYHAGHRRAARRPSPRTCATAASASPPSSTSRTAAPTA